MPTGKITDNFWWSETAVSAEHPELIEPVPVEYEDRVERQARKLQQIRNAIKRSMDVLSWYRSPALNFAVGGSITSQHTKGEATDWSTTDLQGALLVMMRTPAVVEGVGQIIFYPADHFIHSALPSVSYPEPTFCVHWPLHGYRYKVVQSVAEFMAIINRHTPAPAAVLPKAA